MSKYNFNDNETIFGAILRGEIPADKVYEDDDILAFKDINPQAKVHVLVIPKKCIAQIHNATADDVAILGHMMAIAIPEIVKKLNLSENGYRLIINNGADGGQEVPHLHVHILGGEKIGVLNNRE